MLRGRRLAELERLAYLQTKSKHLEAELQAKDLRRASVGSSTIGGGNPTAFGHGPIAGRARLDDLEQRLANSSMGSGAAHGGPVEEMLDSTIIRDCKGRERMLSHHLDAAHSTRRGSLTRFGVIVAVCSGTNV